ncbi:MAG: MFS transporter [Nocardioides sp.]
MTVGRRMEWLIVSLWSAQAISLVGSSAATTAVALELFGREGSAAVLAGVLSVKFGVAIYASPLAGWVADRFSRRRAIIGCDVALSLVSVLLALAFLGQGWQLLPVVFGLTALSGFLDSVLTVSLMASVRDIKRDGNLTRVNGLVAMLENGPLIAGPAVGALLFSWGGVSLALVADAVSFGAAAIGTDPSMFRKSGLV